MEQVKERFLTAGTKTYVHLIIMILIEICFRWVPAFGQITPEGMAVMGVFFGTIYGWIFLGNMGLASLIGILMMGTTMLFPAGPADSIMAAFGNVNTLKILTCFGVAGVMSASGTSDFLAKKIVGARVGKASPILFVFLFMIAGLIIGPFVSFATVILLWDMWKAVCDQLDAPRSYFHFGVASIAIAVNVSFQCFPFVPMMVTLDGVWTGATGLPPAPFINYIAYTVLMALVMFIIWIFLGKKVLKVQLADLGNIEVESQKATGYQKFVIVEVIAYVLLLCLASVKLGSVSTYLNGWGLLGFSILFLVVTLALRPRGSQKSFHEIMSKAVNWDLIASMGMVMVLAGSLGQESVGFGATLSSSLGFLEKLGPVPVTILLLLIPMVATQFLSNLAIAAIFIPICFLVSSKMGLNAYAINVALYMLNSVGMGSPAGSVGSAMYYSHEVVDRKTGFISGWLFTAISFVVAILFTFGLGNIFFPKSLIP